MVKLVDLTEFFVEMEFEICGLIYKFDNFFKLITCYHSPDGSVDIFFGKLSEALNLIYKTNIKIVMVSDFNFEMIKNKNFNVLFDHLPSFNLLS